MGSQVTTTYQATIQYPEEYEITSFSDAFIIRYSYYRYTSVVDSQYTQLQPVPGAQQAELQFRLVKQGGPVPFGELTRVRGLISILKLDILKQEIVTLPTVPNPRAVESNELKRILRAILDDYGLPYKYSLHAYHKYVPDGQIELYITLLNPGPGRSIPTKISIPIIQTGDKLNFRYKGRSVEPLIVSLCDPQSFVKIGNYLNLLGNEVFGGSKDNL